MFAPSQLRPQPRGQAQPTISPKVLNCIVDDTALVQGAKKSTRDGIRKWIAAAQIRLFVPLYTLNTTSGIKGSKSRISSDAAEALKWLDEATNTYPHLVTLQGGFDRFNAWAEVEKFALPKTLFSEGNAFVDDIYVDELADQTDTKLRLDKDNVASFSSEDSYISASSPASVNSVRSISPLSPPTSPLRNAASVMLTANGGSHSMATVDAGDADASDIPDDLRPLFNYILWRVHQELDPLAALENFIFLTDDPIKRKYAQRFGIRVKTLADIRYVIARESQEVRNRRLVQRKEAANCSSPPSEPTSEIKSAREAAVVETKPIGTMLIDPVSNIGQDGDSEEEILLKHPPKAPASMLSHNSPQGHKGRGGHKVIDPNRPSRSFYRPPRGGSRGCPRGNSFKGGQRGTFGGGRGNTNNVRDDGPIDPDSFARPHVPSAMRGGRRLWNPS